MATTTNRLTAIDLFCGGGGFSTGLALACEKLGHDVRLIAVNHDTDAVETHRRNHPWAEQHNAKVEALHPPRVVGDDDVHLLVTGPECTHFSSARGGKPVSEQRRASPWHVVDYGLSLILQTLHTLSGLDSDTIIIDTSNTSTMETKHNSQLLAHLQAIRTAIVGLALGVVTAGLILHDEPMAFSLFIVTCLVLGYAFVPTFRA